MKKRFVKAMSALLCAAMTVGSFGLVNVKADDTLDAIGDYEIADEVDADMLNISEAPKEPAGGPFIPASEYFNPIVHSPYQEDEVYCWVKEAGPVYFEINKERYQIMAVTPVFADINGNIIAAPTGRKSKYNIVVSSKESGKSYAEYLEYEESEDGSAIVSDTKPTLDSLSDLKAHAEEIFKGYTSEQMNDLIINGFAPPEKAFLNASEYPTRLYYYGLGRAVEPSAPSEDCYRATDEFRDELVGDKGFRWAKFNSLCMFNTKDKVKYNINVSDIIYADEKGEEKSKEYGVVIFDKDNKVCACFRANENEESLLGELADFFEKTDSSEIEKIIKEYKDKGQEVDGLGRTDSPEPKHKYKDVNYESWMAKAINFVDGYGYMSGISDTEFAPNTPCSREMMVQILYNAEGKPSTKDLKNPFKDVKKGAWFYDAVIWGADKGATKGVSADEFGLGADLTREQVAQFLYNYAVICKRDVKSEADLSEFKDGKNVSGWATKAMKWAVDKKIINGKKSKSDGKLKLDPQGKATRAEVAQMIMNSVLAE